MTKFTPIAAIVGGILIGSSAVVLMALIGRIAGMTAIVTAKVLNFFDIAGTFDPSLLPVMFRPC